MLIIAAALVVRGWSIKSAVEAREQAAILEVQTASAEIAAKERADKAARDRDRALTERRLQDDFMASGEAGAVFEVADSGSYVEASVLDEAGTVVNYTNVRIGPLRAEEQGAQLLETTTDWASTFRIEKVNCR